MFSMGVKILLADDSPTVHKVIKIILKDEPCEILECSRHGELADKITEHQPQAVFLDFNFSDQRTGYQLCEMIRASLPQAKLLVMYGTFDTVDEAALKSSGADQYVVKPFDTAKFIAQVRSLLAGAETPGESSAVGLEIDAGWSIQETVEKAQPVASDAPLSSLSDDLSDWGIMVPGVIGQGPGTPELPPVISAPLEVEKASPRKSEAAATKAEQAQLPSADDLEYPDVGLSLELEDQAPSTAAPTSKLVALNELSSEATVSVEEMEALAGMSDDESAQRIADQIRDEVETDLWAADAFEDTPQRLTVVREPEPKPLEPEFAAFDESLFEPLDKADQLPEYSASTAAKHTALAPAGPLDLEQLRPMLKEIVREVVAEYCRQGVDKVAWEVIPDLAENIIKQELRKLGDKVARDL